MSKLAPNTGLSEARPFVAISRGNPYAAGDIGAPEIMVCVTGDESTEPVRSFITFGHQSLFTA